MFVGANTPKMFFGLPQSRANTPNIFIGLPQLGANRPNICSGEGNSFVISSMC